MELNVEIVDKMMKDLNTDDSVAADENAANAENEQSKPKMITTRIVIDKRQNEKEQFIKLSESRSGHGGQRSRIILSLDSAKELIRVVQDVSKYLVEGSDEVEQLKNKDADDKKDNESGSEDEAAEKVPERRNKETVDEEGEEATVDTSVGGGRGRGGNGRRSSRDNPNLLKRVRIDGGDDQVRKYNVDVVKGERQVYLKVSQTAARQRLRQRSIVILPNTKATDEFITALTDVVESHAPGDAPLTVTTEEVLADGAHNGGRVNGRNRHGRRAANLLASPEQLQHAKQAGGKFVPVDRSFRSINQNKTFYCDFSENPRGLRLRITEVTSQMRSYVTVPLRCWPMLRDILVSTCDQADAAGLFNAGERKDKGRNRQRSNNSANRKKTESESTVVEAEQQVDDEQ
jgi:hypothetical protein